MRLRRKLFVATPLVLVSLLLILLGGAFDQGNPNSASLVQSSVVATVASPSGGSWSTDAQGDVSAHGGARLYGSLASQAMTAPIVDIAPTVDGKGYWLVASDGQIYCFGDAAFFGDTVVSGRRQLHHVDRAIVGMATTPDDTGYWEVASDGSIYAFGDARYFGPAKALVGLRAQPISGLASTPDGNGYWEIGSGGRLYPFGDAKAFNSTGEIEAPLDGAAPALDDRAPVVHVSGNTLDNASGSPLRLLGVDVSGTEDACVLDDGFSWGPLTLAEAKNIASWHTNVVRVPLNEDCWLGINGAPAAYSGLAYREMITEWVEDLNAAGLVAILDLHWSAPSDIEATEQWPMADANHSITFWTQVASTFKSMPSVVFDLFNEPFLGKYSPSTSAWSCWLKGCTTSFRCSTCTSKVTYKTAGMQQMLDAVRLAGATQPVLVGGTNWSGDPCGIRDYGGNGGVCMWLRYEPTDPDNQVIADFHTYNWTACPTVACWDTSVLPVAAKVPVISAEFGEDDCSAAFDKEYMNWADQHSLSYLAWSWEVPARGSTGCAATNLQLLSNWSGTPTVTSRGGVAVHAHLAKLAAGR